MSRFTLAAISVGYALVGGPALATVEVLYSQISGHPTALVPPGGGLPAGTEFKVMITSGFDRPFRSPDGTKLFFTGLANVLAAEDECYIVVDGGVGSVVAREGTAFGSPTVDLLGTGDQRMGINDAGEFVFGVDTNAATTMDKMVIHWDGVSFLLAAREGDPVPGAATEIWGNSLNSGHILADGSVAFCGTDTGGTLPGTQDDFCMLAGGIEVQTGDAIGAQLWDAFNVSDYWVSPDGAHMMVVGDDDSATTMDRIVVVDGAVVIREGVAVPGSGFVSPVVALGADEQILLPDGSWMARGNNVDTEDWAVRNGVVLATTDDPIVPASAELFDDALFADCFFFITGNAAGDYVVGGVTNAIDVNANAVLVLNGTEVIAREGDPIDLNGNGLADDDAFISVFNNDDAVLTDAGELVFFADARNGALVSIGQMVLRIDLGVSCTGDLDGDGSVGINDLLDLIALWGRCPGCAADINGDGTVNVVDLLALIGVWGACP